MIVKTQKSNFCCILTPLSDFRSLAMGRRHTFATIFFEWSLPIWFQVFRNTIFDKLHDCDIRKC